MFSMIMTGFFEAFKILFKMFAFMLIPVFISIILIILVYIYNVYKIRFVEKIKMPQKSQAKKYGFFKNLFVLFPKQLAYDKMHANPLEFRDFGIHIVVGEQGSGKTMTVVYLLKIWRETYPKLKVFTNMGYKYENSELKHWKQLITRKNDVYGVVNVIDEIKTWFSNRESKDVPAEVLGELCQQRKQRKAIVGTVQVFSELAKPFRSQTHYVYCPFTLFGCLTIVRISKAKYYDESKDKFKKFVGFFIFAHTKELREAYDTYKRIEKYKSTDFSSSTVLVDDHSQISKKCEDVD